MDNNQALREAIDEEDMERLLQLLDQQPGSDLNYTNKEGNTPLITSIKRNNSSMVKCLIEAGCDVNLMGYYDEVPPLHVAIDNSSLDIVHMLIKKGADINAPNSYYNHETPLYTAVSRKNDVEVTSMLLYYEADVNIEDSDGWTPLIESFLFVSQRHCQEVLLNYYDDFSCSYSGIYTQDILHFATFYGSPFVVDLVKRGADVNTVDRRGRCLIYKTVHHDNAEAFKLIWSRMNHKLVLERNDDIEPFFLYYLKKYRNISNYEYLECLYLMLESPIAHLLIKDCIDYRVGRDNSFVYYLLEKLVGRKVLPKDRLSLIFACLSFGAEIKIDDLQCAHKHYGFNEEFKALLYAGNLICSDYTEQIKHCMQEDYYTKGFSWLSLENKQHLMNRLLQTKISSDLVGVPEFPTLLQLSRSKAQEFIQKEFKTAKLYQFHDAVNCLKLPQLMIDTILLKKPIY